MFSKKYKNRISICKPIIISEWWTENKILYFKYKIQTTGNGPIYNMFYMHDIISNILYPVVSIVCHINNLFRAIDRRGFQRCDSDIVRVACGFSSLEK